MGRYYLNFSSKANFEGEFSKEGIPLYSFFGQQNIEHPIVIAQYGLALYEKLLQNNFENTILKKKFLMVSNWFLSNKIAVGKGSGWYIHNQYPQFGLNYPFVSAMAQGEAISVLTRAALLTNNSEFENSAVAAMEPFKLKVKEGGVVNFFNSIAVYEEGPSPIKTMAVLNGFIFSLFGLFDLYLLNNNQTASLLFTRGVNSVKKLLPYYDLKYWTRYYLFDYPKEYCSSFTYHILVAEQLKALHLLTGENEFLEYSNRWFDYSKNFYKKSKALFKKVIYANKLSP
ncbi:MAG: D-glucuronyl C5-epimerase family protein [Ignavibacteria bacterium]|nr:D-glucuronyl C5-epimerase family protein [Ignavibacteria bacterium]